MGTAEQNRQISRTGAFFFLLCLSCLVCSLLIHLLFLIKAKKWEIKGFSPENFDTIVPRTFRMKRVEIDAKLLETEKVPIQQNQPKILPVDVEKEIPQTEQGSSDLVKKGILSKPQESLIEEKPGQQITTQGLESLLKREETTTVKSTMGEIPLFDKNEISAEPGEVLKLPDAKRLSSPAEGNQTGNQQFSSLDELLSNSGLVKRNTAPILMPTDLLFEYDSDALKAEATESLTKLGSLIKRNVQAFFKIEGHTDSFGSDEYNMQLSLRRAEAVKNWLTNTMGIDAARISTVGLGKSRLLVPGTGNVEQQQLNRRVEIVISVPK